jgi:hypothetical protein
MTRADTAVLLRRIGALYGFTRAADNDTIDAWHQALERFDPQAVYDALDRIVTGGEKAPHAARLIAEVRSRQPAPIPEPTPLPAPVPIMPLERIREIVHAGIELGRQDTAFALWWRDGAHGHYPGCDCSRCSSWITNATDVSDIRPIGQGLADWTPPEPT